MSAVLPIEDRAARMAIKGHDWMKAIRRPTPYRVSVGSAMNINPRVLTKLLMVILGVLIFMVLLIPASDIHGKLDQRLRFHSSYNSTYPLTPPKKTGNGMRFRIGMVADLDTNSKSKEENNVWISYMKTGYFTLSHNQDSAMVSFDSGIVTLKGQLSLGGRGMELSELVVFNGKLYTVDDRTGAVYEITSDYKVLPWVILQDGDGTATKGFKSEWATVKDESLWVGGLGKEWTTVTGEIQNLNPQWVKSIGRVGDVLHHDWHENYDAMRAKTGTLLPGYLIHESGCWSEYHKRWFFLPRRASTKTYEETADERRATNLMITADETFTYLDTKRIGPFNPTHGFSSFKFVPGTYDNVILALKSEEDNGKIASYIMAFTIDGDILLPETKVGDQKFEGIEFI